MSAVTPFDRNNIELFQPNQISGLALWLDAADSATITTSGANVTQWRDKSSNAHICISNANYTGTFLPTYNSNAIYKNVNFADNQVLVTSNNWNYVPSWSCFVALNSVSLAGRWLISPHNGSTPVLMGMNTGTPQNSSKIWNGGFSTAPQDITGNHIEYTSAENTSASANLLWYRDGVLQASNVKTLGSGSGTMKMGIGANGTLGNSMAGTYQLYEVLIFNSYLSTTQRQQIESYLAYKWNLQRNLPTNHPYYNSPYNAYPPFTNINQNIKFAYPVLPSDIGGLALWLDAADSSTITLSGTNITNVRDKSGQNVVLSNATGFSYATNLFNGSYPSFFNPNGGFTPRTTARLGVNASFAVTVPFTVFFVAQDITAGSDYGFIIDSGPSGTTNRPYIYRGDLDTQFGNSGSTLTARSPFQGCAEFYNSARMFVNGSLSYTGSLATFTTPGISVGNRLSLNEAWPGHICEIIIYNTTITTTQRQAVEAYLAYKWGLQSSLPTTHPYYRNLFLPNVALSARTAIGNYQYSPQAISGLALWLDAADIATVSLSPGTQNVTGWNDKSGNGYSITAALGLQPTYANNAIRFNGSQAFSTTYTSSPGAESIFIVFIYTTSVGNVEYTLLQPNTSGGRQFYIYNNTLTTAKSGIIGYNIGTTSINTRTLVESTNTQTSLNHFINGTNVGSSVVTAYSGANTTSIGGTSAGVAGLIGSIHEIVIFSSVLSTNQRQQIEGYLAWKWGLQKSLPSNHPFYLIPQG